VHSIVQPTTNNEKRQKKKKEKGSFTFGDNALNTDHRTYEFRKKLPRRDSARNKGTFKSHQHLFPFLQILRINSTSSFRHRIAERLNVLTRTPDNPAKIQFLVQKQIKPPTANNNFTHTESNSKV